jgi:putative transcriptional regulator
MQALRQRTLYGSCPPRHAWRPAAAAAATRGRKQAARILDLEQPITSPGRSRYTAQELSSAARRMPVSRAKHDLTLHRLRAGALCALLLWLAAPSPTSAADNKRLTAILLIAQGDLRDPSFADSVVLVMNHLGPAPVGLVVNRPTAMPVSRLFPDLKQLAAVQDKVYFGGPVQLTSVWFLFRATRPPAHAVEAFSGIYLSANRELLLQLLAREKPMDNLRIFIGHAGWAPGQLEAEIERGAWGLEHADGDAIFKGKSEHPWPAPDHPDRST